MKNIFKFLGIAVLACGMMVSCGKDNPEEGTDTTPVTPPAPQRSFTVTYGSTNLDITSFQAVNHSDEGYLTVYGYESGEQNSRFVQPCSSVIPSVASCGSQKQRNSGVDVISSGQLKVKIIPASG